MSDSDSGPALEDNSKDIWLTITITYNNNSWKSVKFKWNSQFWDLGKKIQSKKFVIFPVMLS